MQTVSPEQARREAQPLIDKLKNRWWRFNTIHHIRPEQGGALRFRCNWAQVELYGGMHYRNKILKVRKLGISTFAALFIGDFCMFNANKRAGIVDATLDDAKKKLDMIRFTWEMLDSDLFPETAALGRWIKSKAGLGLSLLRDSREELAWNNGSSVYADVSLRGDTPQILHVSELGTIALENADRAANIVRASFNSVAIGNVILDESTHEGGRYGVNYEYIRKAQASAGKPLSPLDWKFFFFPWFKEPKYRMALLPGRGLDLTARDQHYFADLEKTARVKLTDEQKFWWTLQAGQPHADMNHQFPGTPEEALTAIAEGAIYGTEMNLLRALGRVMDFPANGHAPIDVFCDIGFSDFFTAWAVQMVGLDILALNYHSAHAETPGQHVARFLEWQQQYGRPIRYVYLPHDAERRDMQGKTTADLFRECGMKNLRVVPRTPDVWVGIKHLRSLLPRFYFHATACEREFRFGNDRLMPSGLGAIEGYRKKLEMVNGNVRELPDHNEASHGADGLRTFAEAHLRGQLEGPSHVARETGANTAKAVGVGEFQEEKPARLAYGSASSLQVRVLRD